MSLSVCMITHRPLGEVAEVLRPLVDIADEIVLAIDDRASLDGLDAVRPLATSVMRVELTEPTAVPTLPWLYAQCRGDWILRMDGDEVVSTALTNALPGLLDEELLQVHLERRWLFPDAERYISQRPWWPDWQTRLMRNTPAALQSSGLVHTGIERADPSRFADLPIYHLERLLVGNEDRATKTSGYEQEAPGLATSDGHAVNSTFYYPENHGELRLGTVPSTEGDRIRAVLDAPSPGKPPEDISVPSIASEEVKRHWARRAVGDDAYQARLELLEPMPAAIRSGSTVETTVAVYNDGDETWPYGNSEPNIRLAYRWLDPAGQAIEGHRTEFSHPVPPGGRVVVPVGLFAPETPGRYEFRLDLVHEFVRWFESPIVVPVEVR